MRRRAIALRLRHGLDERRAPRPIGRVESPLAQCRHRRPPLLLHIVRGRIHEEVDIVRAARLACPRRIVGRDENLAKRLQRLEVFGGEEPRLVGLQQYVRRSIGMSMLRLRGERQRGCRDNSFGGGGRPPRLDDDRGGGGRPAPPPVVRAGGGGGGGWSGCWWGAGGPPAAN